MNEIQDDLVKQVKHFEREGLRPGVVLNQVLLELDADTRFHADLRLQHITSMAPETRGVRLGCEFVATGGDALRALQRFIDQTQKRGKLLSLG